MSQNKPMSNTPTNASLDFETRSLFDITLGSSLYAADPSTRVMCLAMLVDSEEMRTERFDPNEHHPECPPWLLALLPSLRIWAWNVTFEQNIWRTVLGWPEPGGGWRCRMAVAASKGMPQGLDKCAAFLGLETKHKDGQKVMKRTCIPGKDGTLGDPSDEDWQQLVTYCAQDVRIEHAIGQRLGDLIPSEIEVWKACNAINHRGMRVDRALCEAALAINAKQVDAAAYKMHLASGKQIEPEDITNCPKILAWINAQPGVEPELKQLTALSMANCLRRKLLPDAVRAVIEARRVAAKISVNKFQALLDRTTDADPVLRHQLKYNGAQETGRWKSAGESSNPNKPSKGVQVQNMPRPQVKDVPAAIAATLSHDLTALAAISGGEIEKALVSVIRPAIVPSQGNVFLISDYSGIEARVCPWLCDDQKHLGWWIEHDQGKGLDGYCRLAETMFGRPITKADKMERAGGKEAWLSGQYQVGPDKYGDRASTVYGVDFAKLGKTPKQMIEAFRREFHLVKRMWDRLQQTVLYVIGTQKPATCGYLRFTWNIEFSALVMHLPSGREIIHHQTTVEMVEKDFGYGPKRVEQITFKDYSDGHPVTAYLYGGKLLQKATQAIGRDLFADCLVRLESGGFCVVTHSHDEAVVDSPNPHHLGLVEHIMRQVPLWATGLPIAVEAYVSARYAKEPIPAQM